MLWKRTCWRVVKIVVVVHRRYPDLWWTSSWKIIHPKIFNGFLPWTDSHYVVDSDYVITSSSPQWWSGRLTTHAILYSISSRIFGDLEEAVRSFVHGITPQLTASQFNEFPIFFHPHGSQKVETKWSSDSFAYLQSLGGNWKELFFIFDLRFGDFGSV